MEDQPSRLTGSFSQVDKTGIGIEVHYNVEANTKGYNRKMSIGLFATGDQSEQFDLQSSLQEAAVRANDLVFQACNRLENKLRRMHGRDILNPSDGTVLGLNAPEPTYWEDPVGMSETFSQGTETDFDDVPF